MKLTKILKIAAPILLTAAATQAYGYIYAIKENGDLMQLSGSSFINAPEPNNQDGVGKLAVGGNEAFIIRQNGFVRRWDSEQNQFLATGSQTASNIYTSGHHSLLIQSNNLLRMYNTSTGSWVSQGLNVTDVYFHNDQVFHRGTDGTIRRYQGTGTTWSTLGQLVMAGHNTAASSANSFVFINSDGILRLWDGANSQSSLGMTVQSVYSDGSAIFVIDSLDSVRQWDGSGVGTNAFSHLNFTGGAPIELFAGEAGLFAINESNELYSYGGSMWGSEGIVTSSVVFDTGGRVYALDSTGNILKRDGLANWTTIGEGFASLQAGPLSFVPIPEPSQLSLVAGLGALCIFACQRNRQTSR